MAVFNRRRNRQEAQPEQTMPAGAGFIGGQPAIPGMQMPGMGNQLQGMGNQPQGMGNQPQGMEQRTPGTPGPVSGVSEPEETGIIDRLENMSSDSVQEARKLGQQMGAEQGMLDAGIQPIRIRQLQNENRIMNRERLNKATETLLKYKAGKASVNRRVIQAQNWWKLNNWEEQQNERGTKGAAKYKSNTGWLWNCIVGKHADAIDSYPEPVILPRAEDDKDEAKKLSKIVPVVMEINGFENVYNECSWQKMQEGTGIYGIFWDPEKLDGLGDISIKKENILNLYWEPGVDDIQNSRNVFFAHYEDTEELVQAHPELEGEISNASRMSIDKYKTDDSVDTTGKSLVIDWYYHKNDGGRKELHYCQYVNESVIYSTEEEGEPLYEHGLYPFVMDPLFPVAGSPAGYGYIDIGKDAQMDIDCLSQAMVKNTEFGATPRHFIRADGGVNEQEYADASKPFVHVNGLIDDNAVRPISCPQMPEAAMKMLQQKIDELKFITGNTDVNNGGVPSGVTAASAIAALKEDSGRSSKDSTKAAYRAYRKIVNMVIELIRQFYDIPRQFRIIGQDGNEEYTTFDNSGMVPQTVPNGMGVEDGLRMPVFDIEVRAQRENAYTKMSQNELAIQMYQLGVFNPQQTDQALQMIDMMDFRGKEEMRRNIERNGTMQQTLMQVSQIAMALAQRYDPAMAQQLGMVLNEAGGSMGMQMPQAQAGGGPGGMSEMAVAPPDNTEAANLNENAIVKRAKERAANATRPD